MALFYVVKTSDVSTLVVGRPVSRGVEPSKSVLVLPRALFFFEKGRGGETLKSIT